MREAVTRILTASLGEKPTGNRERGTGNREWTDPERAVRPLLSIHSRLRIAFFLFPVVLSSQPNP
jgi:hypothetical protein